MVSKVAVVDLNEGARSSLERALRLLGNIDDLNAAMKSVVVKVGVFNPNGGQHATVGVVDAIASSFNKAPRILVVESDNYRGTGSERLQIWKNLFNERVVPFNLSDDAETRQVTVADEAIGLSHVLFKPNVFVSTHVLRKSDRGSLLKNLLGLIPDKRKVRFHKKLEATLLDVYEAIGGVDLAVLDATYTYPTIASGEGFRTDTLIVGRDAVAVETVGAVLVGLRPEEIPVIREAVRRGLGEGNVGNIEVVGASLEDLKEEFATRARAHVESHTRHAGPKTWGGLVHNAFKGLMEEGFFRLPNRRTVQDVAKALEAKGIPTEGNHEKIEAALARRVKNGTLRSAKMEGKWVYWTK